MIVNGMAAVVFLVHGGLAWEAVGLLAAGSLVGGYVGARVALALPARHCASSSSSSASARPSSCWSDLAHPADSG